MRGDVEKLERPQVTNLHDEDIQRNLLCMLGIRAQWVLDRRVLDSLRVTRALDEPR